jgi:hypothetical protein
MERKRNTRQRNASLTKRTLVRATKKATRKLAAEAMRLKGYVVQAENGWIVKIDDRGFRRKISRINGKKNHRRVVLD